MITCVEKKRDNIMKCSNKKVKKDQSIYIYYNYLNPPTKYILLLLTRRTTHKYLIIYPRNSKSKVL